jgi:cullin 3
VDLEKTWSQLSENICEIHNQNASNLSFEETHRLAYNMVLHRGGNKLYEGVKKLVAENLDRLVKDKIIPVFPSCGNDRMQQSQEGEILLKALKAVWDIHLGDMLKLSQVLKYMVGEFPICLSSEC